MTEIEITSSSDRMFRVEEGDFIWTFEREVGTSIFEDANGDLYNAAELRALRDLVTAVYADWEAEDNGDESS